MLCFFPIRAMIKLEKKGWKAGPSPLGYILGDRARLKAGRLNAPKKAAKAYPRLPWIRGCKDGARMWVKSHIVFKPFRC